MSQSHFSCAKSIAAVSAALQRQHPIDADVAAHIAGCPVCRAGMLLLVRRLDPVLEPPADAEPCAACQADLAAFIEMELDSPTLAAHTYPHVWWHLWSCGVCLQAYEFTHMLLRAQSEGRLAAMPTLVPTQQGLPQPVRRIRLPRQSLMLALPARRPTPAVYRGSADESSYVVYDDTHALPEPRGLSVVVQEQPDNRWLMTITITPPAQCFVSVTCGSFFRVAAFDEHGVATISDLSSAILTDLQSPDLEVAIIPPEQL